MKITLTLAMFFISILTFLSLPTPSLSLSKPCNKNDEKVLFQIKNSLGNPYHLASWQPTLDCCKWYCVKCNKTTGRIIELTISSGPVPSFISQLTNLNFLDLSFNSLTGSIPPELAKLTKLYAIGLDRNKLTGTIPESFGMFKGSVPDLYLSHNQLTGDIPKSLGYLNFSRIDVSRNQLTGDFSMFFGRNKTIQIADFSRNRFWFDLSKVEFPTSLTYLDMNHNKVYGSLPASLTGLSLQGLNVSYNSLCGKIPQGGDLQKFDHSTYFHNRCLCGSPFWACAN